MTLSPRLQAKLFSRMTIFVLASEIDSHYVCDIRREGETTVNTYEMEFETQAEAADFLSALHYRRFPGTAGYSHVPAGYDDFGNATITFARECYSKKGEPIRWYFAEQIRRPAR